MTRFKLFRGFFKKELIFFLLSILLRNSQILSVFPRGFVSRSFRVHFYLFFRVVLFQIYSGSGAARIRNDFPDSAPC
jgi:hypothetical protein